MAGRVSASASLKGTAELEKTLRRLGAALGVPILRGVTRSAVKPVFEKIKARAPVGRFRFHTTYKGRRVGPGFLQQSLRIVTKKGSPPTAVSAAIGARAEAFYGPQFVNRGTVKMRRQRFLDNTFYESGEQMRQGVASGLKDRIEKVARGAS